MKVGWKIWIDQLHLVRIFAKNLIEGATGTGAVRTLKIGELSNGNNCIWRASDRCVRAAFRRGSGRCRAGRRSGGLAQSKCFLYPLLQKLGRLRPFKFPPVQEERRRSCHTERCSFRFAVLNLSLITVSLQRDLELGRVEMELPRVIQDVRLLLSLLVFNQQMVHLPVLALRLRGQTCFMSKFRTGVSWEGKILDDKPNFAGIRLDKFIYYANHLCAIRTLEVAELNNRDRRFRLGSGACNSRFVRTFQRALSVATGARVGRRNR